MRALSKLIRTALFVLAVLSLTLAGGRAQKSSATKRLLFLYWYDRDYPSNVRFDQSFRRALQSISHGTIDYYTEYLETNRFRSESQSRLLHDYLRQKYADLSIDVLVTNTPPALDFFLKYRSDLFPNTPIVFATTEFPAAEQLASGPGATGFVYLKSHRENLDLALKLHPDTEQVFIVSGADPIDTTGRKELQGYPRKVAINYLTDLPLEELLVRVKSLPERSLVLYVRQQLSDRLGKLLESQDVLAWIARSSRAPIYGMVETNVGLGIVGGYVFTTDGNAAKLAELAVRVANGARPVDIPVQKAPYVPMFDWRQLQRWNIPENRLPPGSIIRFREVTVWQQYKWRIVATVAIVMLQALLISSLLLRRKQAQRRAVALVEAQRVIKESEERFRRVFEEGPLGVALVRKDYRFLKVNNALCQMLGYDEAALVQMSFIDITHPEDVRADVELAERLFKREIPFYRIQKRYVKKNGESIWINLTASMLHGPDGEPLHGLAMVEDITEAKRAHEEALARQKLESLGVLAGGIAHDFNNLLGGILAEAEVLETDLAIGSESNEIQEDIQRIKTTAIRGSEIVRELMIYAGETQKDLNETVEVSRLVEEMLKLLKVSISKQVDLRTDFRGDLPTVWGSASHIRQVVMNLVLNASEAIGETKGVITVTVAQVSGGTDLAPSSATDLTPGDYVRIEVSDTGCGMTEETKAKIFDPFFSTKFPGRGLGLAVVQGIVRDLGGKINIVSAPGQGTVFQVLLPRAPKGASEIHSKLTFGGLDRSNAQARTILVVEDDETLRRAVSKGLLKRGFSVIEASDGSIALELINAHKDDIDLVLLDVTLPGASSREVLEEALRIRPDLKVIVTSAYGEEIVDAHYSGLRVNHFIRKPFQFDDLVRLFETVLSAKAC